MSPLDLTGVSGTNSAVAWAYILIDLEYKAAVCIDTITFASRSKPKRRAGTSTKSQKGDYACVDTHGEKSVGGNDIHIAGEETRWAL